MNSVEGYIILNRKISFITKFFISISILMLIFLIVISQFKYKKYYYTFGEVINENNNYQLLLYIPIYDVEVIKSNNILIVDKTNYIYNISSIYKSKEDRYFNIVLDIKLNEEDKIVNNILKIKIEESNKKIFYYIKDYFKKGEDNEKNKR